MPYINQEVLRFMVGQVDWPALMHDLIETQPETVAELLNNHFAPKDDKSSKVGLRADLAIGLDKAFMHVARAVNTSVAGRMTTTDKLIAIKELRNTFGLELKEARMEVEKMMERYSQDPCYYPRAISGPTGHIFE